MLSKQLQQQKWHKDFIFEEKTAYSGELFIVKINLTALSLGGELDEDGLSCIEDSMNEILSSKVDEAIANLSKMMDFALECANTNGYQGAKEKIQAFQERSLQFILEHESACSFS